MFVCPYISIYWDLMLDVTFGEKKKKKKGKD